MKKNKFIFSSLVIFSVLFFAVDYTRAQENSTTLDYGNQPVVDMDLDGLTDLGEKQIFGTDPNNADTDGNGLEDGAEILGTAAAEVQQVEVLPVEVSDETSWAWYVSRVSGLVAFVLLYISIFLGLTIRLPFMRKYFAPLYALNGHRWISVQATILALVHGSALLFDKYLGFKFVNVFVPFTAPYKPEIIALGIISFYLMIILVVTSYGRKYLFQEVWRAIHFLNIILYAFVIVHTYTLGTDMKNFWVRNIFVYANALLTWLMLTNMFVRIKTSMERRRVIT